MGNNWAAVLEAARKLPREQRRWIGHELLKTEVAVDAYDDADDFPINYPVERDWVANKSLDGEAIIRSFRPNVKTEESSRHETVFANHELFANVRG